MDLGVPREMRADCVRGNVYAFRPHHSSTTMTTLFAETFLAPIVEPSGGGLSFRYDEQRAINVLPDGRPVVEAASTYGVQTLTEVRSERDDFEAARVTFSMETVTKVRSEANDRDAADLGLVARESRATVARDAFRPDLDGGTHTRIRAEADDFARDGIAAVGDMTAPSEGLRRPVR